MRRRLKHSAALVALTSLFLASLSAPVQAAAKKDPPPGHGPGTMQVQSATDAVLSKLDPKLEAKVKKGDTAPVAVFATVQGDTTQARAVLDNARVAKSGDAALVLGSIPVQALPKLAAVPGVVAIQPIEMTRTGQPLTDPDPDLHKAPTAAERKTALAKVKADDVPYTEAPPLQTPTSTS